MIDIKIGEHLDGVGAVIGVSDDGVTIRPFDGRRPFAMSRARYLEAGSKRG